MASSYNRKSSSSGSSPKKPTYRKSKPTAGKTGLFAGKRPSKPPRPSGVASGRPRAQKASPRVGSPSLARKPVSARPSARPASGRVAAKGPIAAPSRRQPAAKPRGGATGGRLRLPSLPSLNLPFKRIGVIAAALVAVLALAGVGFLIVANTGLFSVTEVEVVGTEHVPQETAQALVEIPQGTTLLNVSSDDISSQLKRDPWVKDVEISREFPHKLVVTPVEHNVRAVVYISTADVAWALSDEGTWIAPVSLGTETGTLEAASQEGDAAGDASDTAADASGDVSPEQDGSGEEDASPDGSEDGAESTEESGEGEADASAQGEGAAPASEPESAQAGYDAALKLAQQLGALLITDVGTDVSPKSGEAVDAEGVTAALAYANGFSEDFRAQVKSFSAASAESLSLFTTGGVEVALGPAEDISYKETVVSRILSDYENVTYVNVRTPSSPTWRSVTT